MRQWLEPRKPGQASGGLKQRVGGVPRGNSLSCREGPLEHWMGDSRPRVWIRRDSSRTPAQSHAGHKGSRAVSHRPVLGAHRWQGPRGQLRDSRTTKDRRGCKELSLLSYIVLGPLQGGYPRTSLQMRTIRPRELESLPQHPTARQYHHWGLGAGASAPASTCAFLRTTCAASERC